MSSAWDDILTAAREKAAKKRYCIAFIPRSSSTRLGEILSNSGLLGKPREWFNPALHRKTLIGNGFQNLGQYYQYLKTVHQSNNVFGAELAWPHMIHINDAGCADLFDDIETWFFLRRRDYVAQAVSMHCARETGIYHSVQKRDPIKTPVYDGLKIAHFTLRLFQQETGFKRYFQRRQLQPTSLWSEDLIGAEPVQVINTFCQTLGLSDHLEVPLDNDKLKSRHEKISGGLSADMIEQFRQEHPDFIDYWNAFRGEKTAKEFFVEYPQYRFNR